MPPLSPSDDDVIYEQPLKNTSFAQIPSTTNPVEPESEYLFHDILINGEATTYFVWHVHKLCSSQQILYLAPSHCLCWLCSIKSLWQQAAFLLIIVVPSLYHISYICIC